MFISGLFAIISKLFFFTSMIKNRDSFPEPLSQKDEKLCFEKLGKGDAESRDTLIRHNLRLVAHIVKKYDKAGENDDLISIGTIGLIKAIGTYDVSKGTAFATFASKCIENEILMMIRSTKKFKQDVSLYESIGRDKEGNELTLMDLLSVSEDGIFQAVENSILAEKLDKILKENLSEREYGIIIHRYGLRDNRPLTQREIAKKLGISRSYISRIEKKVFEKLRGAIDRDSI